MKTLQLLAFGAAMLMLTSHTINAQKRDKGDDALVTIRVDGKDLDIEDYFEEWGESFGRKVEEMFDKESIHVEIDSDDIELKLKDISVDIDDFAESIAATVKKAVTNMSIELKDLDPDEIGNDCQLGDDEDLETLIDEIEEKYDAEVKNIDRLKIKIREDYVKMELDATLTTGKKVEKIKIYAH